MQPERKFNFIARAKDGSIQRGEIEAADRNDALRQLKGRGVVPLGVTEFKPQKVERSRGGLTRREMSIAAVALIVVGGAVALWMREGVKPVAAVSPVEQKSRPVRQIVQTTNVKPVEVLSGTASAGVVAPNAPNASNAANAEHAMPAGTALTMGTLVQRLPRRERAVQQFIPYGGTNNPPPLFKTLTEQVLSYYADAQLGDVPPPPFPVVYKEDIAKILDTDIVVYDTDDDEINAAKANLAHAKAVLKEYMANGGTMDEFVDYYQEEMEKAYQEHKAAQRHLMELLKAGDNDGALAYFEKQNTALTAKGIKPLQLP